MRTTIPRILTAAFLVATAAAQAGPPYPVSDHFDGERFFNPGFGPIDKSFSDMLRWRREPRAEWPEQVKTGTGPAAVPPSGSGVAATFVNHATFVLRFANGAAVLVDPIWSERCSPVSFAGPRRVHPPGVDFDSLPRADVVLISHNHYDHLDIPTLKRLFDRDSALFLVPLGDAKLLREHGISRVQEMDWWQVKKAAGIAITFLPAKHWSARGFFDRNESLWGGWGLKAPDGTRVFHAGDTGYGPHFKAIRERWGAPDLALLPIGAYAPRWFMGPGHVDPAQSVQAFRDLGAREAVGMHFGTFQLTNEPRDEPARLLRELAADLPFHVPEPGQAFFAGAR